MENLTGKRFGRIKVLSLQNVTSYGHSRWKGVCDCGGLTYSFGFGLKNGKSQSCGCLKKEKASEVVRALWRQPKYRERFLRNLTGRPVSGKTRLKLSIANKGRKCSEETKQKIRLAQTGKRLSLECRYKISKSLRQRAVEGLHPWKGGMSKVNKEERQLIMGSIEYRLWREAVFKRDKFSCVGCGDSKGGNLHADHIKPFALFPELRFELSNGRTLCAPCHRKTLTYGRRIWVTSAPAESG